MHELEALDYLSSYLKDDASNILSVSNYTIIIYHNNTLNITHYRCSFALVIALTVYSTLLK